MAERTNTDLIKQTAESPQGVRTLADWSAAFFGEKSGTTRLGC